MKLAFMLLAGSIAMAQSLVPRPAPELQITDSSGRTAKLSSYLGDVVLLAFVTDGCSYCRAASKEYHALADELGPRGFRVLEVFVEPNSDSTGQGQQWVLSSQQHVSHAEASRFLGVDTGRQLAIPQIVVIDRSGMIRAKSAPEGTPMLLLPDVLATLVDSMVRRHQIQ